MNGIIRPCPDGPDADVRSHRGEQLLHAVLVPVHPADRIRIVIKVRGQTEESLPSVDGTAEDVLPYLILCHTRELGLKCYMRFYQVVTDLVPLRDRPAG